MSPFLNRLCSSSQISSFPLSPFQSSLFISTNPFLLSPFLQLPLLISTTPPIHLFPFLQSSLLFSTYLSLSLPLFDIFGSFFTTSSLFFHAAYSMYLYKCTNMQNFTCAILHPFCSSQGLHKDTLLG